MSVPDRCLSSCQPTQKPFYEDWAGIYIVAFVHTRKLLEQQAELRRQMPEGMDAHVWDVGDQVTVANRVEDLDGKITKKHDNGTLDVEFDVGGTLQGIHAARLSVPETAEQARARKRTDKRTYAQRKLDRETATLYDTNTSEELQHSSRSGKITFGLIHQMGAQVCTVLPLIRIKDGTHRVVPASTSRLEREPECVPVSELIAGALVVGTPGTNVHFSTWNIDTEWEASAVSAERNNRRHERQQRQGEHHVGGAS